MVLLLVQMHRVLIMQVVVEEVLEQLAIMLVPVMMEAMEERELIHQLIMYLLDMLVVEELQVFPAVQQIKVEVLEQTYHQQVQELLVLPTRAVAVEVEEMEELEVLELLL